MIMRWWTTIQSFATRLRQNQANNDITTKKGLSTGATTTHTNQEPNQELPYPTPSPLQAKEQGQQEKYAKIL
ncbi:hypothetical protein H5410_022039 [Solanum commersonii]|uniref:Uncharacterized protein n=1 Tax=Solanum commersonii TaxID=4109 RepID=A0A9J5ZIN4_SOLCO|nr:hypothetical protein H5410_022039 [Solanum commersonii]